VIRRCARCHAEVRIERTRADNPIELDADPHPDGEWRLEFPDDGAAVAVWVPTPELREVAHKATGVYRRHAEVCAPLTLDGIDEVPAGGTAVAPGDVGVEGAPAPSPDKEERC
jgi:hypothetical protein